MPVRVLLLALALALTGYAVTGDRDRDRCEDARQAVFSIGVQLTGPAAPPDAVAEDAVRRLRSDCEDAEAYVSGARSMLVSGHPDLARDLAAEAARRQPEDVGPWGALALAADALGDRDRAADARRRVRALNPRGEARP